MSMAWALVGPPPAAAGGGSWPTSARRWTLTASPAHPARAGWSREATLSSSFWCYLPLPAGVPLVALPRDAPRQPSSSPPAEMSFAASEKSPGAEDPGFRDDVDHWLWSTPPVGAVAARRWQSSSCSKELAAEPPRATRRRLGGLRRPRESSPGANTAGLLAPGQPWPCLGPSGSTSPI